MNDIHHIDPGPILSQATVADGVAYLAGQIGPDGPHRDFETECRAVFAAVDSILFKANSHRKALLHVTVHIRDIDLISRFNPEWTKWLDGVPPPARVAVQTPMVSPVYNVALSCIAKTFPQKQHASRRPPDARQRPGHFPETGHSHPHGPNSHP